jgi:hypothetical protein
MDSNFKENSKLKKIKTIDFGNDSTDKFGFTLTPIEEDDKNNNKGTEHHKNQSNPKENNKRKRNNSKYSTDEISLNKFNNFYLEFKQP